MTQAKPKRIRERIAGNRLVLTAETSLRPAMQHWLEIEKFAELERTTYDRYECSAKNQIYPFIGDVPLSSLTRDDFKELIDGTIDAGYAYTTIKKMYSLLKGFFDYVTDQQILEINPFANVKLPRKSIVYARQDREVLPTNEGITILEDDEIVLFKREAFRCYSNGKRCYKQPAAYTLMLNTGLRPGELPGVLNKDIDLETRELKVRRGVKEIYRRNYKTATHGRELYVGKPKSKTSRRCIPLNAAAIEAIIDLRNELYFGEDAPLVCSDTGGFIRPNTLRKRFYRILAAAGIEQKGPHCLRHTFATKLVNGVRQPDGSLLCLPIRQVADILGHSTTQVTEMYYVRKDTSRLLGVTDQFCF